MSRSAIASPSAPCAEPSKEAVGRFVDAFPGAALQREMEAVKASSIPNYRPILSNAAKEFSGSSRVAAARFCCR
jgi:hypothetical protein